MVSFFTKTFYCCLFAFASFAAKAQTKFTASVTPSTAGKDEYITLKLTVANGDNIQNIQPPALNDFIVVSGPNQESEMNSANGFTEEYISLSYVLKPKQQGRIIIGSATAQVDGKIFKSNPVTVTVTNEKSAAARQNIGNGFSQFMQAPPGFDPFDQQPAVPQYNDYILHKGENVQDKVNKNMQLKLQTDKTSCYVGEPILATYKLYTRLRSESNLTKNPSFNGFSVVDMTRNDPVNYSANESLNGRAYDTYIIRKAQLYPLQAGQIELETATLDNKIVFLKAEQNAEAAENVSLTSKPVTINVKPLPDAGKPADFKGAVGNFSISTSLLKNNFSADETGKLQIVISGKGNMQLITAPAVGWPAACNTFDAKSSDNTDNTTVPLSGSKTFEIPFVVEKAGSYIIPAVSFSYFDPAAGLYKTVNAPQISFTVSAGTGKKTANFPVIEKAPPVSLFNSFFAHRWLIILFLAGIIIACLIFWMSKEKKDETPAAKKEMPGEEKIPEIIFPPLLPQHNPLQQTEDCLHREECVEFYSLLNSEMRAFLANKFTLDKDNFTVKMLMTAMDRAGVDNIAILQTQQLMQEMEWQLYTPFEKDEKLHQMYAAAQTIIQTLSIHPPNP